LDAVERQALELHLHRLLVEVDLPLKRHLLIAAGFAPHQAKVVARGVLPLAFGQPTDHVDPAERLIRAVLDLPDAHLAAVDERFGQQAGRWGGGLVGIVGPDVQPLKRVPARLQVFGQIEDRPGDADGPGRKPTAQRVAAVDPDDQALGFEKPAGVGRFVGQGELDAVEHKPRPPLKPGGVDLHPCAGERGDEAFDARGQLRRPGLMPRRRREQRQQYHRHAQRTAPRAGGPEQSADGSHRGVIVPCAFPRMPMEPKMSLKPQITYDDFAKIDLRVATIVQAEPHPNADRLLKLQIDLGFERRQICAGIREFVDDPASLVGRQIIVVANLAPRKIRGEESNGMLLAASVLGEPREADAEPPLTNVVTLTPAQPVPPGSTVG